LSHVQFEKTVFLSLYFVEYLFSIVDFPHFDPFFENYESFYLYCVIAYAFWNLVSNNTD
jgi:hypothetical protein